MKHLLFIVLIYTTKISMGQIQWFPEVYNALTNSFEIDTVGSFPVSYIKSVGSKVYMYGHHTNYQTLMKSNKNGHSYKGLTLPVLDSISRQYSKAEYFFMQNKLKSYLIIKRDYNVDTIRFIKSNKSFRNINSKWG